MKKLLLITLIITIVFACHHYMNPYEYSRYKKDKKAKFKEWVGDKKSNFKKTWNKPKVEETKNATAVVSKENIKKDKYSQYLNYKLPPSVMKDALFVYNQNFKTMKLKNHKFVRWELLRDKANTTVNCNYLNNLNKELIILHNYVRMDPLLFRDTFFKEYAEQRYSNWENNHYCMSLYKTLSGIKPMCPLFPNAALSRAALFHSVDLGKSGKIGHKDSDDTTNAIERIKHFIADDSFKGESCSYSESLDPLHHLMILLIDQNVESLGHRFNILNPSTKKIGIGIADHKVYKYNITYDFSY